MEHCQKENAGERERGRSVAQRRDFRQGHARRQLSQQLVEGGCGRQSRRKGEHKQGRQSRKSATCGMSEGEKETGGSVFLFEKGLDEEVVDLSGDKCEHRCDVCVCVLVCVPSVSGLFLLVIMV